MYLEYCNEKKPIKKRPLLSPHTLEYILSRYFDGVENVGICGACMTLEIKEGHIVKIKMDIGIGANTKAELIALW